MVLLDFAFLSTSDHSMRLFLLTFCLSSILTSLSAFAQNSEPLTGGSELRTSARFEVSPVQQYLTARARADSEHRSAIVKYYDMIGYNYAQPTINAGVSTLAPPPVRTRRIYMYPGSGTFYQSTNTYGF
jgi:hypothetical protein